MLQRKNILHGKIKIIAFLIIFFNIIIISNSSSNNQNNGKFVEIKILDKINSKNSTLKLKIGKESKFKNLLIKPLRCNNSEFDDDPEIIAYLQVKDVTIKNKDKVFVFNDWTFASSPSLKPFDHPVYDFWLTKCIN